MGFTLELWGQQAEEPWEHGRALTREVCPQLRCVSSEPEALCGFLFNAESALLSFTHAL